MTAAMEVRSGPGRWWHGLGAMLRWHFLSLRLVLPVLVVVQALVAAGLSIGISLFFAKVDPRVGLFLGTGAAVISLILIGLVVSPQLVASDKEAGSYDFLASLPVPRSAAAMAWVVLTAVVGIPAMLVALVMATWRFDLSFALSPAVVPAVLLVIVCGSLLGYAVGHGIERPRVTQVLSQVFAFVIIGFTPITFPPENLPNWLVSVHEVLPFYHMGVIFRGATTQGLVSDVGRSYAIVVVWTVVAMAATVAAVRRRK